MKRGRTNDFGSNAGYGKYKKARTDVYVPEALVIGAQQSRVAMPVARPRPPETKYYDVGTDPDAGDGALAIASVAAAATWAGCELDPNYQAGGGNCLFAPEQGTGYSQRVGRRITVRKIRIRGEISVPAQQNQTAMDYAGVVRLVLYQDKQTGGVQAQAEQVIGPALPLSGQVGTGYALTVHMMQNPENFGRFRVLWDKTFKLTPPDTSYDGTNIEQAGFAIPFKISLKLNVPVNFSSNALQDVASIVDNSFHLIGCHTSALSPLISYVARTVFVDE